MENRGQRAANVCINLQPLRDDRTAPTPLFAHRKGSGLTFFLGQEKHPHVSLYLNGHWVHALTNLLKIAPEKHYQDRVEKRIAYYCGTNPIGCRILTEVGAVSNRITDSNNDGIEDHFVWDAYPESTAFVQIGLLHDLEAQAALAASQNSLK